MKMRGLKTIAFGLALTMMSTSAGVYAHCDSSNSGKSHHKHRDCLKKRTVEQLTDVLRNELETQFAGLNNIYTYLGASANPNPATNAAVAGLIQANGVVIQESAAEGLAVLGLLGVPESALLVIKDQISAFIQHSIAYAIAVNLANTGQPGPNQIAIAALLENDAQAIGISLLALTGDPLYFELLGDLANLTTQIVQAYRGVLADGNIFGAIPSNPASETSAAVAINSAVVELVALISNNLGPRLAQQHCSGNI